MRKIFIIFGILCLILAYAYYTLYVKPTDLTIGERAPNFACEQGFELNSLQGHYVFLDFWGSWCVPCRKQNPNWVALYETFQDAEFEEATGFEIVSIALEENKQAWERAKRKDGLNWPLHCVELERMQSPIAKKYDVRFIPANFLINPAGNIVGINMTKDEISQFLRQKMTE